MILASQDQQYMAVCQTRIRQQIVHGVLNYCGNNHLVPVVFKDWIFEILYGPQP